MNSWAIPCATWALALVAYVALHVVEKRCAAERRVRTSPARYASLGSLG